MVIWYRSHVATTRKFIIIADVIDRIYRYKSVIIQILHDAELLPITCSYCSKISPIVVDILDLIYRYKWVTIQILHDGRLVPFPHLGWKFPVIVNFLSQYYR